MAMGMSLGFMIFTFALSQVCSSDSILDCDDGWVRLGKFCYHFVDSPTKHMEAIGKCQQQFCTLTSIWGSSEQQVIKDTLYSTSPNVSSLYWIGLYKTQTEQWLWRDGSNTSKRYWAKGEPKLGGCVAINTVSGKWHVRNCTDVLNGYICRRVVLRVFEMGYPWITYQNGTNRVEKYEKDRRATTMRMKKDSQQILDNKAVLKTISTQESSAEWCLAECLAMNGPCVFVEIWYAFFGNVRCKLKKIA